MQRATDLDLLLASQVAGDSAMFNLLGGNKEAVPKPTDADIIASLVDALERMIAVCPNQGPTKEIAFAALEQARRR